MSTKLFPSTRIAKIMARAGVCSRRDADRWIEQGRVRVDGKVVTVLGTQIDDPSRLKVDGQPLPTIQPERLWLYYKPVGLVTTHRDPEGRATVFAALPDSLPRLISVGRLDQYSEGLLLLTNDGHLAREMELPSTKLVRIYSVHVSGSINMDHLTTLTKGVCIDNITYTWSQVVYEKKTSNGGWVTIKMQEGKNREIRKVMDHFGYKVVRLIRTDYGPFSLGKLKAGEIREVSPARLQQLQSQLVKK